ncbi:hypothetical protein [Actinoplanes flavus]|uniref:Uncharacterized protein n=1 Tax=Actinoplanes flavus TaxID=2820290 RepID=A0ABS3ULC3_9ACTN|nr:hypothetical protein [Actinoplanes flavus]MBO3739536.1 hypothetical protein [Actinoplanes flavus]
MSQYDTQVPEAEWFSLVMRCPACLSERKEPGPAAQWFHASDDGFVQVGSSAQYRCTSCRCVEHVKSWRYACEAHQTDFRPTSSAHLANALSTAGQITSVAGRQWMQRFLENLGEW